jgi:7-carboxy-7-deazaguanine synthase (Cx14CxxC type)
MARYRIKEMFYSLQGEGARSGRAAVFCRFSKCNLWNGREESRADAVCRFCDTDIVGIDGQNGGAFAAAETLADAIVNLWPRQDCEHSTPYVIFTGGEPLLQLDRPLIEAMHRHGYEVAVETNGTLPAPEGIDWICLSPKSTARVVLSHCDELKLVYPQEDAPPERFARFPAQHYFLSPMADPRLRFGADNTRQDNTQKALAYCLAHPQWRLTLQLHKLLGID